MGGFEPAVTAASDHSVIGDGSLIALVSRDAVIDFLCWPDFGAPTLFAELEAPERGLFALAPHLPDADITQSFISDKNVLVTQWQGKQGSAEVIDILLPKTCSDGMAARLVRRATAMDGAVTFKLLCRPRPNGGQEFPRTESLRNTVAFRSSALQDLVLGRHDALRAAKGEARAEFTLQAGASATFILSTRATVEYYSTARLEALIGPLLASLV